MKNLLIVLCSMALVACGGAGKGTGEAVVPYVEEINEETVHAESKETAAAPTQMPAAEVLTSAGEANIHEGLFTDAENREAILSYFAENGLTR